MASTRPSNSNNIDAIGAWKAASANRVASCCLESAFRDPLVFVMAKNEARV